MKLARRRPTQDVGPPAALGAARQAPAPSEEAPRGAPVVAFVGLYDGHSLIVAIDARPGRLALRASGSGDVLELPTERLDDQPAYRAARIDLHTLPGSGETYDVVLVRGAGRGPVAVWSPPLDRARTTSDGSTEHQLRRAQDGTLQVRRTDLTPAVELIRVEALAEGIRLTLSDAGDPGHAGGASGRVGVALLGSEDQVVATYPTEPAPDGRVRAVLATDPLAGVRDQLTAVVVGEPGAWLPVRRHANGLQDAGRGAPLPELRDPETEEPRLRLRWGGRALLQARVLDPEAEADPA